MLGEALNLLEQFAFLEERYQCTCKDTYLGRAVRAVIRAGPYEAVLAKLREEVRLAKSVQAPQRGDENIHDGGADVPANEV